MTGPSTQLRTGEGRRLDCFVAALLAMTCGRGIEAEQQGGATQGQRECHESRNRQPQVRRKLLAEGDHPAHDRHDVGKGGAQRHDDRSPPPTERAEQQEKPNHVREQGKRGVRSDDSMAQELLFWRALCKMKGKPPGIDRGEA